jgi:hypothetical protein
MRNPENRHRSSTYSPKLLGQRYRFYNGRREDDSGFQRAFAESDDDLDLAV